MKTYIKLFLPVILIAGCFGVLNSLQHKSSYRGLNLSQNMTPTERLFLDTVTILPRADNNDTTLKARMRIWYYTEIGSLLTGGDTTVIKIKGDGWRGRKYVVPVYSYDNENWHYFPETCIADSGGEKALYYYEIRYPFRKSPVFIARAVPYPTERIETIIDKYSGHSFFRKETIGVSPGGYPIYLFKITDPSYPDENKESIRIHSGTHPGETQACFTSEGIIDYLMDSARNLSNPIDLSKVIFYIVPIVNIDGFAAGNGRYSPSGYDVERQWLPDSGNRKNIADRAAPENRQIWLKVQELIEKGTRFRVALNMHGKNALEHEAAFLYTNFKMPIPEHGQAGKRMFTKHLHFAKLISDNFSGDTFRVRMSYNPKVPMEKKPFPEARWWANFKDTVMAATIEIPSSRTWPGNKRPAPDDFKVLGKAIAVASYEYAMIYSGESAPFLMKNLNHDFLMRYYEKRIWEK